jgi:predicted nucleic acid-binding protein
MLERFVDTSGWAELADASLLFHSQAVVYFDEVWQRKGKLITTNYVLAELTGLLISPLRWSRVRQIQFLDDVRHDPATIVIAADAVIEAEAWQLWESRIDKNWTFVDCLSFVVMRRRGLTEALTTDHHFEQAGFARLLR